MEVALVAGTPGQKEAAPVRVGEQPDVHEDLVAEHIDIQLVGDVADQLHEEFGLAQLVKPATSLLPGVASIDGKIKQKTSLETCDHLGWTSLGEIRQICYLLSLITNLKIASE